MVLASRSVQRSTTCSASLVKLPARSSQVSPLKSVTSTTSVSPSHARASRRARSRCGPSGCSRAVGVDRPDRMAELEHDRQVARTLEDLERLRVVDPARRAEREALRARIGGRAGREVLLPLLERPRLVGDRLPFDDAGARRRVLARLMRLEVEVRARSSVCQMPEKSGRPVGACAGWPGVAGVWATCLAHHGPATADIAVGRQQQTTSPAWLHHGSPDVPWRVGVVRRAGKQACARPAASRSTHWPRACPLLARKPLTVTSSPVGKSVLRSPRRSSALGRRTRSPS